MNRRLKRSLLLRTILLLSLSLIGFACSKNKDAAKAASNIPPPTVVVELIDQRTVPIYSEYVGQTKADETVELRARVEGVLQKIYFKEGSPASGRETFTIDKRPYDASLQAAKAILAKAWIRRRLNSARRIQAQAQPVERRATYSRHNRTCAHWPPRERAVTEIERDAAIAADTCKANAMPIANSPT
jgi:multidrug efflux pump subunit AcrA (membrane-fusion protein)